MMALYDFERNQQLVLIKSHLSRHGDLVRQTEGSFGEVFTLETNAYPTHIIAKCPKISKFGNAATARQALGKLVTELEVTLKYYRHSGVQRIASIELVHAWPFLISRKRKGTLADLIAEPNGWSIRDKVMSLTQIAHTLNYCRKLGLVAHQDIKPANIFFDDPVDKYAIDRARYTGLLHEMYVADFGIADAFRDIGQNSGSRPYMPPEQYERGLIDGSKIDVFALGVITYECLMDGLHPIGERTADVWPTKLPDKASKWTHEDVWKKWSRQDKSEALSKTSQDLLPALRSLIEAALSADLEQRPSMDEFEVRLRMVLASVDTSASEGLSVQLAYLDSLADSSGDSGWPYMEDKLRELREFYARWS